MQPVNIHLRSIHDILLHYKCDALSNLYFKFRLITWPYGGVFIPCLGSFVQRLKSMKEQLSHTYIIAFGTLISNTPAAAIGKTDWLFLPLPFLINCWSMETSLSWFHCFLCAQSIEATAWSDCTFAKGSCGNAALVRGCVTGFLVNVKLAKQRNQSCGLLQLILYSLIIGNYYFQNFHFGIEV